MKRLKVCKKPSLQPFQHREDRKSSLSSQSRDAEGRDCTGATQVVRQMALLR